MSLTQKLLTIVASTIPNFVTLSMLLGVTLIWAAPNSPARATAAVYWSALFLALASSFFILKGKNPKAWVAASWLALVFTFPLFELFLAKLLHPN